MPFYEITGLGKQSRRKRKPRRYFAKDEVDAIRLAKKDGMEVETINLIGVWGCVTQVAGCSHKNADNTSRQNILRKIKAHDPILLEHEVGNRHDKHATKVMRSDGEQLGYLPQRVAHDLIEGYFADSGCDYWALNLGVERMDDDTDLLTARILLLVSLRGLEREKGGIERELSRLGINELSAETVNWQSLRGTQRTPPKAFSKPKGNSKKERGTGCLGVMTLTLCLFMQLILFLLN